MTLLSQMRKDVEVRRTSEAIRLLGFERALSLALEKSIEIIESEPRSNLPIRLHSWSQDLLVISRKEKEFTSSYLTISRFYRALAHRVYWYQREMGHVDVNRKFLQVVV